MNDAKNHDALGPGIDVSYVLMGIYVALLVSANAAGGKLIELGTWAASATVIPYALSFLVTDLVSEIYDRRMATRFVWIGFGAVIVAVAVFQLAIMAEPAAFYAHDEAFRAVLGSSPRLLVGGLGAFLISQHVDVRIYAMLRRLTSGRHIWLRNTLSTVLSQLLDTIIFIIVAFYGTISEIPELIVGQFAVKCLIAVCDTPLMYGVLYLVRRSGHDAHTSRM